MSRELELNNFTEKANDLIASNYILAEIKIVSLLKAIAVSDTITALFKNCLTDFDYEGAKKKFYVENQYLSKDKKSFVLPTSKKDVISFVFMVLMDIDGKRITLPEYLDTYFFVDGSSYSSYNLFIRSMIVPFVGTVQNLVGDIIGGKVEDPNKALKKIEEKKKKEAENKKKKDEENKILAKKAYGESIIKVKDILEERKKFFSKQKLSETDKAERIIVIDKLLEAVKKEDKEEITYAFLCYYHMGKSRFFKKQFKLKEIRRLLRAVVYEV